MLRLSHAVLGAALAITAACARRADSSADADSAAAPIATTPLTGDSSAPAAAAPAGTTAPADSATSAGARTAPPPASSADSGAARTARAAAPTSTRPAAATARSTAPVPAGSSAAPRGGTGSTTRGAAAVARSTSPVATSSTTASGTAEPATPTPAPAQDELVRVNKFMSYNAAAKTVTLQVTAALTSQRGGFNFNGGSDGSQTITVPQGWTVRMHVRNVDAIPHSAILIVDQKPLPNAPDAPAIPRAYTSHVTDGLPAQTGEDDVEFRASKAGNFLIFCGVPGHGPSGMYIRFVVDADATKPSYSM